MPPIKARTVLNNGIAHRGDGVTNFHGHKVPGFRFDGSGKSFQTASVRQHLVCDCENPEPESGAALISEECPIHNLYPRQSPDGVKVSSRSGRRADVGNGARFTSRDCGVEVADARKGAGAGAEWFDQNPCKLSSKSSARKQASAQIAKIPLPLSRHIAVVYRSKLAPAAE